MAEPVLRTVMLEPHCCALEIMIVTHTLTSQNCYENQWKNYYFYLKDLFYVCSVCVSTCMHTHGNAASTCLPVGMCIWLQYLQKLKEGIRFPWIWSYMWSWIGLCECWKPNLGPWQVQYLVLTLERSLLANDLCFKDAEPSALQSQDMSLSFLTCNVS